MNAALRSALLLLPALVLLGCNAKDQPDQDLSSGAMHPPWDSPAFTPKALEGFAYAGPESLFAVFPAIARLDSLFADSSHWRADAEAADTLRLAHLLDTAFAFPEAPEASMPYAYDDSYRDDTLHRSYYGHGLFVQDHPCAETYVLSGRFLHPARWLKAGLTQADMVGALGRPAYWQGDTSEAALRYISRYPDPAGEAAPGDTSGGAAPAFIYEGANFYFLEDSLFAAVLHRSRPCH